MENNTRARERDSRLYNFVMIAACVLVIAIALASAFGSKPVASLPPQKPRQACIDGVVYLHFQSGAVFAKITPDGHPARCT